MPSRERAHSLTTPSPAAARRPVHGGYPTADARLSVRINRLGTALARAVGEVGRAMGQRS